MADILHIARSGDSGPRLLFIEPYMTHSHRAFAQGLMAHVPGRWTLLGLPGRNFRWRMRGAPLFLANAAADILNQQWDGLVCSSMLGLAELRGLVPALANAPAVVVFHENQLAYPAPGRADSAMQRRDLYLALSNIATAAAAQRVVFNSRFHRNEFLGAADELFAKLPDMQPQGLVDKIAGRTSVLPIPVDPGEAEGFNREPRTGPLRLVWNHRWEHDKDPEALFKALFGLADSGADFQAAVIGPRPARWPEVFDKAPARLGKRLVQLGPAETREQYWQWLFWADVAVSTARQEYFGLSMAEAAWAGCLPLAPADLVYPELYPAQCLYQRGVLQAALAALANDPDQTRRGNWRNLAKDFTWEAQAPAWQEVIREASDETQNA